MNATQSKMLKRYSQLILFVLGIGLLVSGFAELSAAQQSGSTTAIVFDTTKIREAICQLLAYIEGAMGALLMIVAGIGAIMASVVGSYSTAMSMLVVGCGSFILRSLISLWFGPINYCGAVTSSVKQATIGTGGSTGTGSVGIGPVQLPSVGGTVGQTAGQVLTQGAGNVAGAAYNNATVTVGGVSIQPSQVFGSVTP